MKKLALTIIAFAALSSAAYASYEQRDWLNCLDAHCDNVKKPFTSSTMKKVSPLAVENNARALTAFEIMQKNAEENLRSNH
jgi:hypothetical protein